MTQDGDLLKQVPNSLIVDKVKDFENLLTKIKTLDDEKRILWIEIYENALLDRQNAHAMFLRLVLISENNSTENAIHGKTMSSYIERMQKANDQIIKLAELVGRAEEAGEVINSEQIFDMLSAKKKK